MNLKNIDKKAFDQIFRSLSKNAFVFLRSGKSKQDNYDPFRDTGFEQSVQNPLPVKVLTKPVTPGSLVHRQMGLAKAGATQIILQDKDVELIKNSEKIEIDGIEYYVFDDAVGNKFQIFSTQFAKFSKIVLFRRDT